MSQTQKKVAVRIAKRFATAAEQLDDPYRATDGMTDTLRTLKAGRRLGVMIFHGSAQRLDRRCELSALCENQRERNPLTWPNPGDVFRMKDGRFMLFDWSDGLQFGFLFSDGETGGYYYLNGLTWRLRDEGASVHSRCETNGWPFEQKSPNPDASREFLIRQTGLNF